MIIKQLRISVILFFCFAFLTGIIYPSLFTEFVQVIFPHQANGSLIIRNDEVEGSELIGQQFNQPKYFWGRPSATGNYPYNAAASSGSNLSAMNPDLIDNVQKRISYLNEVDPSKHIQIPVDLITSSGSGLDPHISLATAHYQAERVAKVREIPIEQVITLIDQNSEGRQFGFLGEPRVNVLKLNLALDALK